VQKGPAISGWNRSPRPRRVLTRPDAGRARISESTLPTAAKLWKSFVRQGTARAPAGGTVELDPLIRLRHPCASGRWQRAGHRWPCAVAGCAWARSMPPLPEDTNDREDIEPPRIGDSCGQSGSRRAEARRLRPDGPPRLSIRPPLRGGGSGRSSACSTGHAWELKTTKKARNRAP
jgi:hypothetical protein